MNVALLKSVSTTCTAFSLQFSVYITKQGFIMLDIIPLQNGGTSTVLQVEHMQIYSSNIVVCDLLVAPYEVLGIVVLCHEYESLKLCDDKIWRLFNANSKAMWSMRMAKV